MRPQPGTERAVADDDRPLARQARHHFVQRDVPTILDQPHDEGCMRIQARRPPSAAHPRRRLAEPRPSDPPDRRRDTDPEPGCSLACRMPLARSLQNPPTKIIAQCPRHRPPSSTITLNQAVGKASLHNRFNKGRKCSSLRARPPGSCGGGSASGRYLPRSSSRNDRLRDPGNAAHEFPELCGAFRRGHAEVWYPRRGTGLGSPHFMMGKEVFWVDYRLEDAFLWAGLNA
jgi:hypothetical protein